MLNATSISSLAFLLIAIAFWQMSGDLTEMGSFFPRVIAAMLAMFSVIQLVVSIIQRKKESPFAGIEAKNVIIMFIGIVAYVALMIFTGFLVSGILFMAFFFWYLSRIKGEKPNFFKVILLAVAVCGGFYIVFNYVFLVPLPEGIIFGG
ncbi:MAG: tripartite tricarboxylate transporter TctB family protein [Bacillota bacterium]